jgi:hypothetical protein
MIYRISFIALLAGLAAAQVPSAPCCNCESSGGSDDVPCLSAKKMRERVDHIEALKPSGLDKGLNLAGIVVMEIRFEPNGKVACVRAKSGHPIAVSAAMAAIPMWTFKRLISNGVARGGCGQITIKYRLRDHRSSTALQ